ncbi:MAG: BlaI/MecI/CopY family transcriptional regulator [Myxococcota bacterium]
MARRKNLPLLTRAETEVMRLLWQHGPSTVQQLMERMERQVAYTTVLTIVRILEQKGYIAHAPHPQGGRAHLYRAAVEDSGVRRRHVRDLVDRLFGGRADGLVVGLIEDEALTRDELEGLRARIDQVLGPKRSKP